MPEKYNPLKSAELSGEQNYNMIDGILNNAVAPLPQPRRNPWTRYGKCRPNAGAGSVRNDDEKRRRCVHLNVMVTPEEQALIAERMAEAGSPTWGPI